MGRRKQKHPNRSGGISRAPEENAETSGNDALNDSSNREETGDHIENLQFNHAKEVFVEINQNNSNSDEQFDVAEVFLGNIRFSNGFHDHNLIEEIYEKLDYSLQLRFCVGVDDHIRIGHWPVISADNIFLEFVCYKNPSDEDSNDRAQNVVFWGNFDGPAEGVSGLVHLVNERSITLKPVIESRAFGTEFSPRFRVVILKKAFEASGVLSDTSRKPWKKSMVNMMAWLRPEVTTDEAKYRVSKLEAADESFQIDERSHLGPQRRRRFSAAAFYEAIKPSKEEPMLKDELPDLIPQLRPYQRRAAYWMIQRERGEGHENGAKGEQEIFFSPLCVPVDSVDLNSRMFYNPFCGNVSWHLEASPSYVSGGILADEMGLGKTVELLACISAHRRELMELDTLTNHEVDDCSQRNIKRLKRERVECICGAVNESPKYEGLWIQCDICDAWQHANCVGYKPGKSLATNGFLGGRGLKQDLSEKSQKNSKKKSGPVIKVTEGDYVCPTCSELIQVADCTTITGATLIVCPAPILSQWQTEIARHMKIGSLKTCVYEGVRGSSLSNNLKFDMDKLAGSDIVLTTYDVLKEDLSHDSDRHDGDRRFMRFQKRYQVVPTPLTRIFWWRICLDEAQMVESNAAAATEMALRLSAQHHWCITGTPIQRSLDDMYGLLRFIRANPFDFQRWWVEVVKEPYEKGDIRAMDFTHSLFKKIMWRSSKAQVSDELQLPPQEELVSWLTFSPIEAHFYQRQHETCVIYAQEVIESFRNDIHKREGFPGLEGSCDQSLSHEEAAKLLVSLLKLRQACCHPQVGSSGLRSLQQTPMTMEEILEVLIGKAKIEGEEALRRLVVALNGLAGIAAIENDPQRAIVLYKEALALSEEHSEHFRLDPLLGLHILHNLSDLLQVSSQCSEQGESMENQSSVSLEGKTTDLPESCEFDNPPVKRQKTIESCSSTSQDLSVRIDDDNITNVYAQFHLPSKFLSDGQLRVECENIKQKFLSAFLSKLSLAQQEFKNLNMQVHEADSACKGHRVSWWMHALDLVEQNEWTSDLVEKISEGLPGARNNSKSSRIISRFRSISGLKYLIQTGLDSLENSRKELVDRLLEIDQTMEKPRDVDIERVRFCKNCQMNDDGPLCIHCELDELFQGYETRLFLLTKGDSSGMVASAEEALDLQKQKSELNRFFGGLSQINKTTPVSNVKAEENRMQRQVKVNVVVSRSPSELEVILKIIKSFLRSRLGRDHMVSANKHLFLFETMRKEFPAARSLSVVQAQYLRAHDEIKMATSRLRLRETNDEHSTIDALSSEELVTASVQFSGEKFLSLATLSRMKGQLRYLKGLALSKQRIKPEDSNVSSMNEDQKSDVLGSLGAQRTAPIGCLDRNYDEACPVCQDKAGDQKMVFQCGHVTCCKCFILMTEGSVFPNGRSQGKWVMCPTCRQQTVFGNIAFVDDSISGASDLGSPDKCQDQEKSENSICVHGSYGTKIEAVTRRILWIRSTDPEAKVLVFSSWNDVLDVLEHSLGANSVSHIRMKGGRKSQLALRQFKGETDKAKRGKEGDHENRPIQVLLLLIQHGANGLNLLEAQHVILVEPLLNPATEAQAINRVHRIGQDKATFVHRFIVKDTVEESIYKLNKNKPPNSVINSNNRNNDHRSLTLRDVESLFLSGKPSSEPLENGNSSENLTHLPPSVAAALAAENRLKQSLQEAQ
ncbi:E3 ubiquitin-protein ligase SHPRH isoform X1 [Amborella trichopoda]|uniref:RING-type domain-containing protein n=2 Tax=Amborella trichopoda TaxID=13333 RepID=W1P8G1_AMBTC|nr:E3 ubiquitin-protein ligase SHPRH isoform X1 [Amborella trichopoda]ERN04198.1 hypothetical protein AMTR_s00077p00115750 [Amborella trichopoda]|eukprot:XP_020521812.1 E3 ubiquitin-protein ligase SHPRH isoform X1 [Amborella trichopoda]